MAKDKTDSSVRKSDQLRRVAEGLSAPERLSEEAKIVQKHLKTGMKWAVRDDKGRTSAEFEVVDLDPSMAAMFLGNQRPNRKLNLSVVKKYTSDLLNNKWTPNFEHMWLDKDLRLADGLHRCSAVVESKKTMPGVLLGIAYDEDILLSLDQGFGRTMENIQRIAGDTIMARSVSGAIILEHNDLKTHKRNVQSITERRTILQNFEKKHGQVLTWANDLVGGRKPSTVPSLAVAIRCMKKHGEQAYQFWLAVLSNQAIINGEYCSQANAL